MKSAAERVITTSDVNNNLYEEVKEKLALSRKIRVKPKGVGEDRQSSKYNINMKTEQSSFSDQKIVTEYQLVPSRLRERKDMISRVKTMAQEKRENQRYVSQFQKKIKAQLSRLPIEHYNSRKTTQLSPVHNVYRRRKNTSEVIPYRPSTNLKLPPLQIQEPQSQQKIVKRYRFRQKNNYSTFEPSNLNHPDRYQIMRERLNTNREDIKELHKKEIDKVSGQKINKMEKSRVMKDLVFKYEGKSKFGDDGALDLMSRATIARANILL